MKKMNLYMDFDDVLVQSKRRIVEMINEDYNTNYNYKDIKSWNFDEIVEVSTKKICEYFSSERFFQGVNFYTGAKYGLMFLTSYFNVKIVSAGSEDNLKWKAKFIKNHFPFIEFIPVTSSLEENFNSCKSFIKDGIIVDDNKSNLINCDAEIRINYIPYGIHNEYSLTWKEIHAIENKDDNDDDVAYNKSWCWDDLVPQLLSYISCIKED